jgi:hypothetical protein
MFPFSMFIHCIISPLYLLNLVCLQIKIGFAEMAGVEEAVVGGEGGGVGGG